MHISPQAKTNSGQAKTISSQAIHISPQAIHISTATMANSCKANHNYPSSSRRVMKLYEASSLRIVMMWLAATVRENEKQKERKEPSCLWQINWVTSGFFLPLPVFSKSITPLLYLVCWQCSLARDQQHNGK